MEAERNIQRFVDSDGFPADALLRHYALLNEIDWEVVEELKRFISGLAFGRGR